jgi:hypothetical protein
MSGELKKTKVAGTEDTADSAAATTRLADCLLRGALPMTVVEQQISQRNPGQAATLKRRRVDALRVAAPFRLDGRARFSQKHSPPP